MFFLIYYQPDRFKRMAQSKFPPLTLLCFVPAIGSAAARRDRSMQQAVFWLSHCGASKFAMRQG
jgi:hypothetical protein